MKKIRCGPCGSDAQRIDADDFLFPGSKISAWVSPPQLNASCIVQVAASMAHAASMALPPWLKICAPAVAAKGFPVMAIQC